MLTTMLRYCATECDVIEANDNDNDDVCVVGVVAEVQVRGVNNPWT